MSTNPRTTTNGFTLIELLVVIAIIAILAAILFPVFAQARAKARQAACLSNGKQIGLAMVQYVQDYDGVYPPAEVGASNPSLSTDIIVSWPTLIYPYVKSGEVFVCPSADEDTFTANSKYISTTGGPTDWASKYGAVVSSTTGPPSTKKFCSITDSKYPSTFTSPKGGDGTSVGYELVKRLSYTRNLLPNTSASFTKVNAIVPGFQNATSSPKSGFCGLYNSNGDGSIGTTDTITESDVVDISGTIHIFDAIAGVAAPTDPRTLGNSMRGIQASERTDLFRDDTANKPGSRHSDGFIAIYGDGHSKWIKWGSSKPCNWTIQDDTCL